MTKRYICATSNDNPNGEGCEYAILEVTKELAQHILARRKIFLGAKEAELKLEGRSYASLYEMYFWGYHIRCYHSEASTWPWRGNGEEHRTLDLAAIGLKDGEVPDAAWTEIPADIDLEPYTPARTECGQTVIRERDVLWVFLEKHCDNWIRTAELPYELLEEALA